VSRTELSLEAEGKAGTRAFFAGVQGSKVKAHRMGGRLARGVENHYDFPQGRAVFAGLFCAGGCEMAWARG
jgi:hypothetical protein